MTKTFKNLVIIFVIALPEISCHWKADIIAVRNNSPDSLLISRQFDEKMNDTILFNESFYEDFVAPNTIYNITLPNRIPKQASDSERVVLYIFNLDSVNKYQKLRKTKGIFEKSFLNKTIIQLNKVENVLDTIYINSQTLKRQ